MSMRRLAFVIIAAAVLLGGCHTRYASWSETYGHQVQVAIVLERAAPQIDTWAFGGSTNYRDEDGREIVVHTVSFDADAASLEGVFEAAVATLADDVFGAGYVLNGEPELTWTPTENRMGTAEVAYGLPKEAGQLSIVLTRSKATGQYQFTVTYAEQST